MLLLCGVCLALWGGVGWTQEPTNDLPTTRAPSERVPIPDPTRLTTQQLYREISAQTESFTREVAALRLMMEIELRAIKADILTLRAGMEKGPDRMDEKVRVLKDLFSERFTAIATQVTALDQSRTELATATADNLRTALLAYKELMTQQNLAFAQATTKAEQSTGVRIAQLEALVESKIKALDEKSTESTARLLRLEGGSAGERLARTDAGNNTTLAGHYWHDCRRHRLGAGRPGCYPGGPSPGGVTCSLLHHACAPLLCLE